MSAAGIATKDPHRKPAMACAGLIATAVLLVVIGRNQQQPRIIDPTVVAQSVDLRFNDLPDGTVVASDAASGVEIERIAPGAGGFVRVTMRSFANERKQRHFSDDTPFTLARMENGDLLLQDSLTGRTLLLNAFGRSNEGAFAQLLDQGRMTQ